MPFTIATHVGTNIARQHNIRDKRITDKESHIDPNGIHEVWLGADLTEREAYHKIFDTAVSEYNMKQKRNDRKIADYYEKIKSDKQKHTAYEMIVSVGNMDERIPEEVGYEILKEFASGWIDKNPNMIMFGCYYHADEQGVPHIHIDYIPVGTEFRKGLSKQVSSTQALKEMGFVSDGCNNTAQTKWIHSENARLEEICNNHGIEVYHPMTGREHQEKKQYILERQREKLEAEISELEEKKQKQIRDTLSVLDSLENQKSELEDEITELKHDKQTVENELNEIAPRVNKIISDFDEEMPSASKILPLPEKKETASDYRTRIIPIINKAIDKIISKSRSWHRTIIDLVKENKALKEKVGSIPEKDEKIKTLTDENIRLTSDYEDLCQIYGRQTLREKLAEYREKRRLESEKRREKTSVTERLAEAQKQVDQNKNNSRTVKHTGQER